MTCRQQNNLTLTSGDDINAFDVLGPGTLEFVDQEGRTVTYAFLNTASGGNYPYRLWVWARSVTANTTAPIKTLH